MYIHCVERESIGATPPAGSDPSALKASLRPKEPISTPRMVERDIRRQAHHRLSVLISIISRNLGTRVLPCILPCILPAILPCILPAILPLPSVEQRPSYAHQLIGDPVEIRGELARINGEIWETWGATYGRNGWVGEKLNTLPTRASHSERRRRSMSAEAPSAYPSITWRIRRVST